MIVFTVLTTIIMWLYAFIFYFCEGEEPEFSQKELKILSLSLLLWPIGIPFLIFSGQLSKLLQEKKSE